MRLEFDGRAMMVAVSDGPMRSVITGRCLPQLFLRLLADDDNAASVMAHPIRGGNVDAHDCSHAPSLGSVRVAADGHGHVHAHVHVAHD